MATKAHRLVRWVTLFLCVLLLLLPTAAPVAAQTVLRPRYAIDMSLDPDSATAKVHQVVTYANQTGVSLSSLVFHITAAYYDAFALKAATVGGQPVAASLDGIVLEVPLAAALAPGEGTTVTFDFDLTLPQPGNLRFGFNQGIIALGNWYPVLAVYRQGALTYGGKLPTGWDRHQQNTPSQKANGVEPGDAFFTEVADYDVKVALPRPFEVAHTGDSQPDSAPTALHYAASAVRDFALALSERYESVTAQVGGTSVTAFYLPEHRAGGQQYLESATGLMAWANRTFGTYPYGTYFVAETSSADPSWVGQEYPGVVFVSSQSTSGSVGLGSYLDYLVIHETVHQWFYGRVGDDQLCEPWVDEALTTHLSYRYYESVDASLGRATFQNLADRRRQEAAVYPERPVNTGIYDYENEGYYFAIVYRKGASFLEEARQLMGDDAYLAALRGYYQRFAGGLASGRDLLAALAPAAGASFPALVAGYFDYPEYQPAATATKRVATATVATPRPGATGTARPASTAAATATASPTASPTATASATATATPEVTATATVAATPVPLPSPTAAPLPTSLPTPVPPVAETALDWLGQYGYLPAGLGLGMVVIGLLVGRLRGRRGGD